MKTQGDNTWTSVIDYLKAVAICLVITNHSLTAEAKDNWSFFFIVRMAVPVFILVSGYNFTVSMRRLNTISAWYAPDRLLRKMRTYILPMLVVFALWMVKELLHSDYNIWIFTKALVLQSYGQGAYYFWIIVQLYLMFPLVYWPLRKYKGGGFLSS